MQSSESSAGRGDPYWYEWFVGLAEVVNLLDPATDIVRVAFQLAGVKGWDDVVVLLKSGKRRCYQVKHTRAENDLTFGDLVGKIDGKDSLIQTLFNAWREAGLNDGGTKCILYTNRESGRRWSSTSEGIRRPPLFDFFVWLKENLASATSLAELQPLPEFTGAWETWLGELNPGSNTEQYEFLRAFEIRDTEADLDGVVARVHEKLAIAFGVSRERVSPLMDTLHRALRKWTTGHPGVTVEELCSELALPAETKDRAPAPPPPSPFFPTRVPIAEELEKTLKAPTTEPVVLLTAEPGAGKTSVISWMTNRRINVPFSGIIDARFFCFEPIRPENPVVAPDASRVHPNDLWFSFLSQIREGLRGRLHELKVPLRNNLLTWQEAREHVMRLADLLGKEHGQRFILAIDGIDHAARAAQTSPQQIADFFASLPSPDELASKYIRLFIAGQPPEHYEQYPAWLRLHHAQVRRIHLPLLSTEDVEALYSTAQVQFPTEQSEAAIRVIEDNAKGNTLATVFAVNEAQRAATVEELAARLQDRRLADGLLTYYSSIWTHMLESVGDSAGVEPCLAGAITMARRGVQPELFSTAFADWKKPTPWWRAILDSLGPLLSEGSDGYRVRHNDVRVFLSAQFASFSNLQRQRVASQLADYFISPDSDRVASHLQLFDLLNLAGRPKEQADHFSVDWIFEAAALGVETDQLMLECKAAIQALARRKKWPLVVSVACAAQTLERMVNFREHSVIAEETVLSGLPPFLPSEISVQPLQRWKTTDFSSLIFDVNRLLHGGEPARALGLMQRWLNGLNLSELVDVFPDTIEHFGSPRDGIKPADESRIAPFKDLGTLCGTLGWAIPPGNPTSKIQRSAVFAFEEGFVNSIDLLTQVNSLANLLDPYQPYYLASWENLLRRLADTGRWDIVRETLAYLSEDRQKLTTTGQAEATWFALRSGAVDDDPAWLTPLELDGFGLSGSEQSNFGLEGMNRLARAFVAIARAIGWTRFGLDPGDIGTLVYDAYEPSLRLAEHRPVGVLVFRAAAMLGRIAFASSTDGHSAACGFVAASEMGAVLSTLWSDRVLKDMYFDRIATDLAEELADASCRMGGAHVVAAINAAQPYAEEFPADFRKTGIWSVIQYSGNTRILHRWVQHWLAADGNVWRLSRDEVYTITEAFTSLAESIGEADLIRLAHERQKWMLIGYQGHKEYGFQYVLDWFRNAASQSPQIWKDAGWKLWNACLACEEQGGDNRLRSEILDAISGAAIRCGASDWWRLLATSLQNVSDPSWHLGTFYRLVDGAELAIREGLLLPTNEMLNLWGLSVSFSFWTEKGDNASLMALCKSMLESIPIPTRDQIRRRMLQMTPRAFCEQPTRKIETGDNQFTPQTAELPGLEVTLAKIDRGEQVSLAAAAAAIREIRDKQPTCEEFISRILPAIGSGKDYVVAWYFVESSTDDSLRSIACNVNDEQMWLLVETIGRELDNKSNSLSVYSNLLQLAVARAGDRGLEDLLPGLEIQIGMHMSWAFGAGPCKRAVSVLPESDLGLTWQEVALRLLAVLFESYSAEVIAAALEGLHTLVAIDETIIPRLFTTLKSQWARRWLLSAAESWAALHPQSLWAIRAELEYEMNSGDLGSRLQSWIVLCRLSDILKIPRPAFPISANTLNYNLMIAHNQPRIMHSPPMLQGRSQLVDRHAGAASKLRRLANCGFDFSSIEPRIAAALNARADYRSDAFRRNSAQRRGTMMCMSLDEEMIVGQEIWSEINMEWCSQAVLVYMAQAFLNNEDAWIQCCPPQPAPDATGWPDIPEYGPERKDHHVINTEMHTLAMREGIPDGWQTISAFATNFTWREDYELRLWYEQMPRSLLIRPATLPTCPSGRTFLWWLGDYYEPETDGLFVSGFFAGGMCRLHHCNVEIMPPKFWMDSMNWAPQSTDPFTWYDQGEPVAIYERLHGVLRDNPHDPKNRQPVLHRWLVTHDAFERLERLFGTFRLREHFQMFPFKS